MTQNYDSLTERFDAALHLLRQHLGPQFIVRGQFDLTPGQVYMLYMIAKKSTCTMSCLAQELEVAPSAITVMLDRLSEQKLVLRKRDQKDRRVVLVELTSTGEEKLNHVLVARKQFMHDCLQQLDTEELEASVAGLEKLAIIVQNGSSQSIREEV